MIETITDFIDSILEYLRHGQVEQIIIAAAQEDREFVTGLQMSIINEGTSCRVMFADSIKLDDTEIAIHQGKMAITTLYSGHALVRPHFSTTTATFE